MIQLILQQQYLAFILITFALIFSLTFHEFGHGKMASLIGDDTAERAGRLTLNPFPHIHPVGLLMVMLIGFGFARPVPTDPHKFNTRWGILLVAAAGPAMNLLLAFITINVYVIGYRMGISMFQTPVANFFFTYLAQINMLLMLFNLLPIGPLDGSYILPYALPGDMARRYQRINAQYGTYLLLGLIALNFAGIPVFENIWRLGEFMVRLILITWPAYCIGVPHHGMPHHSIPSDVIRYSVVREVAAGQMRLNLGWPRRLKPVTKCAFTFTDETIGLLLHFN